MKYKIGIDTSSTGCVSIVKDNNIIEICKYPEREYDKSQEKIIKAKIKYLQTQERSVTKIKKLKAELKSLKDTAYRNYKPIYDMILKYKDNIDYVIIEQPLKQSALGTNIDALFVNAESLGVYKAICSILELPIVLVKPQVWHQQYDYRIIGSNLKEKRECIKKESIRLCREYFKNADDFILYGKKKVPDDNIAESALIALYEVNNE